jgi:TRAP-type C4-dicarboxylate transport system substrate-binding protein
MKKLASVMIGMLVLLAAVGCGSADPTATPVPAPAAAGAATATPVPYTGPGSSAANPFEIKLVRPWSPASSSIKNFYLPFIDNINEKSGGRLAFTDFGGSEVAPAFEQMRPLLANQFQALYTHASYIQEFTAIGTSGDFVIGDWDTRESCGLIEATQEAFAGRLQGAHWTGPNIGAGYKIYLKDEIKTPTLEGLKIRDSGLYGPFIKKLGGIPTRIPFPEIYTALEKGIIDGAAYASTGAHRGSWYNVVKYWVVDELGEGGGTGIFFNKETWDAIPTDLQEMIDEEFERMSRANLTQGRIDSAATDAAMLGEGVVGIEFNDADSALWQSTWFEEGKKTFIDIDGKYGKTVGAAMDCVRNKTS